MHYGIVNEYIEATVSLNALGAGGASVAVDFIIDTGCTEEMILPQEIITQLRLVRGADIIIAVADGTYSRRARYPVHIEWHGHVTEVAAIGMGIEPLIGMGLLRGSNLSVDADPGGRVTITELPRQG